MPDTYTSQFSGEEIDSAVRAAQLISGASTLAELRDKLEIRGDTIPVSAEDSTLISEALTKIPTTPGGGVNPNLLDNWYFGRPVNQRGQMEYTSNYTIDRWWLQADTSLNVVDGGVNVIGKWDIEQFFEKALPNGTYTLSLLYKDKTGSDPLRLIAANRSSGDVAQTLTKDASGLLSVTFTSGNCDKVSAGFAGSTDNVATFIAIKLELGSTQTLAHKEGDKWVLNEIPDFGEQLRRCQRYCRVIGGTNNQPFCNAVRREATKLEGFIPIDNSFRTAPSISVNGYFSVIPDFHSVKFTSGDTLSPQGVTLFFERNDGGTFDKDAYLIYAGADTRIILSADL